MTEVFRGLRGTSRDGSIKFEDVTQRGKAHSLESWKMDWRGRDSTEDRRDEFNPDDRYF